MHQWKSAVHFFLRPIWLHQPAHYLFLLAYLALMPVAALSKPAFHNESTLLVVLKLTSDLVSFEKGDGCFILRLVPK